MAKFIDRLFQLRITRIPEHKQSRIAVGRQRQREAMMQLIGLGQIDLVISLDAIGDHQEWTVH